MATISPGYSFGATEQVTNSKLASLAGGTVSGIVNADIAAGAAISYSKLSLSSSIQSSDLAASCVTSAAISAGVLVSSHFAASSIPSAAYLGNSVVAGIQKFYGVKAYQSSAQSINSGSNTVINFDAEEFDTDTMWSTASASRLICNTAGKYYIWAGFQWGAASAGYRQLDLRLNGGTTIARSAYNPVQTAAASFNGIQTVYTLAVNDYIEVLAEHTAGTAVLVGGTAVRDSQFGAYLLA